MKLSKSRISSEVEEESAECEEVFYYCLSVEFPDEDQKVYVMSDSPLFKNCLKKFDNEHDAQSYALEQFPGLLHNIEKIK